jgi:hypothetical protein
VQITGNLAQNITGNAFWFHSTSHTVHQNSTVTISRNTCIDYGLDCIQPAEIVNLIETDNTMIRGGFVITSDVGATRVGGPLWLQGVIPVGLDMSGTVLQFVISNNTVIGFNGEGIDLDGGGSGVVSHNTLISCFAAAYDPLINTSLCGPSSSVGTNWTEGIVTNNSSSNTSVGQFLNISNNTILGTGGGAILGYGLQVSTITGNLIDTLGAIATNAPVILGNLVGQHAIYNNVTGNTIVWTASTASPAIFEDGQYSAFVSTDQNFVTGNHAVGTNTYEFQKATIDISGTGPLILSSATAGALAATNMVLQTEGASGGQTLKVYRSTGGTGAPAGILDVNSWYLPSFAFGALPTASGQPNGAIIATGVTVPSSPCSSGSGVTIAISNGTSWACK